MVGGLCPPSCSLQTAVVRVAAGHRLQWERDAHPPILRSETGVQPNDRER